MLHSKFSLILGLSLGLMQAACGTNETASAVKSICGSTTDFAAINSYAGSVSFVQTREGAVGRLNKNCSGTFIGTVGSYTNLFLTAGHCVSVGQAASVEFNYEANADGPVVTVTGTTLESSSSPDYAIIQLKSDPGVTPTPLGTTLTSALTIIQHPEAQPKSVAFGTLSSSTSTRLYYAGLDTLGGSSGSGVLSSSGELVGVHTLGGCTTSGGTNSGWTLSGIKAVSAIL